MKIADVKIGAVYLTRIGEALAPVRVVSAARPRTISYSEGREGPARFYVARVGEAGTLPKPRTAGALREIPFMVVHMRDQPWEVRVRQNFGPRTTEVGQSPADFIRDGFPTRYEVQIPAFGFTAPEVIAVNAPLAGVLAARAMVARAIFEAP